ncbi:hypothetical protein ACWC24_27125 [Streptomyces sp. NPDC001443]
MGAFARLLWRSKATEEATAKVAGRATEEAGRESAVAEERTEATAPGPEVAAPAGSAGADGDAGVTVAVAVADPVGIPKQPSAEDVADRAAGEGARR